MILEVVMADLDPVICSRKLGKLRVGKRRISQLVALRARKDMLP
jgi:hypothetical protein